MLVHPHFHIFVKGIVLTQVADVSMVIAVENHEAIGEYFKGFALVKSGVCADTNGHL